MSYLWRKVAQVKEVHLHDNMLKCDDFILWHDFIHVLMILLIVHVMKVYDQL